MNKNDYEILKIYNETLDGKGDSFVYPDSLVSLGSVEVNVIESLVSLNKVYEHTFKKTMPIFNGVDFYELDCPNPLLLAMYGADDDFFTQQDCLKERLSRLKELGFHEVVMQTIIDSIVSKKSIKITKDYVKLLKLIDELTNTSVIDDNLVRRLDLGSQELIDQKVSQLYEMVSNGLLVEIDDQLDEIKIFKMKEENPEFVDNSVC